MALPKSSGIYSKLTGDLLEPTLSPGSPRDRLAWRVFDHEESHDQGFNITNIASITVKRLAKLGIRNTIGRPLVFRGALS